MGLVAMTSGQVFDGLKVGFWFRGTTLLRHALACCLRVEGLPGSLKPFV